jgi:hypothetical protein
LLKIDSALTLISRAGRDDADRFFFAILILYEIYVNDQQDRSFHGSDGVPPLFASHEAILAENRAGVIENERGSLEGDADALPLVDPVLFAVPRKSHRIVIQKV